jgi:hypothetical protein
MGCRHSWHEVGTEQVFEKHTGAGLWFGTRIQTSDGVVHTRKTFRFGVCECTKCGARKPWALRRRGGEEAPWTSKHADRYAVVDGALTRVK